MMPLVLPRGFAVPPPLYTVFLLAALLAVVAMLAVVRPPVTDRTPLVLVPWMATGAALRVLHRIDAFDPLAAPLFGTPAVYVTTTVLAGLVWMGSTVLAEMHTERSADRRLGVVGTGVAVTVTMYVIVLAVQRGSFAPLWPIIGFVGAGVLTLLAWGVLSLVATSVAAKTGVTGGVVLFGHALDGVSTAVGVDVLGAGERSPLPRAVMEAAGDLPFAGAVGVGWTFVLIKLLLAGAVLWAFVDYVEEQPERARLVLALVAAVGLGPGYHNLLLFLATG